MSPPTAYAFDRQRIVVAEEDSFTAALIVATLRRGGHCVTHDPGALSDVPTALARCHLLISSLQVGGVARMELLADLRERLPALSVLYLTSAAESTVIPEAQLPQHFQVLRAPFTIGELQTVVRRLLPQLQGGHRPGAPRSRAGSDD